MLRLLDLVRRYPRLTLALGAALLVAAGLWWQREPSKPITPPPQKAQPERLLSPEVELRGLVRKLQDDNAALRRELEDMSRELKDVTRQLQTKPPAAGPPTGKDFGELFKRAPAEGEHPAPAAPGAPVASPSAPPPARVTVLTTKIPIKAPTPPPVPKAEPRHWLQLPAGSLARVTMLSGVYAPVRQQNPLPVLLHLDDAPAGPNGSRVPLQDCLAVGRALGDQLSSRATIQLESLSCILPSGQAFSRPLSGWVADDDGILGIRGTLIEQEGPILARVALGGFLQGAAAALGQLQTTTLTTPLGGVSTQVTGNATQYAVASGLAQTANRMAQFYEGQLQRLVPAIFVESGKHGHAVVQSGLTIEGYPVEAVSAGGSPWRLLD